jgi:hypothetical protein
MAVHVLTLFHGGRLDERRRTRLWTSANYEYAKEYADTWETVVWKLTVDLSDSEILDLTEHGTDARAVAAALTEAGLSGASVADGEANHPQCALRGISDEAIRAAGYRAVRLCEWTDWGHPIYTGSLIYRTVSLCIIDPSAIVGREIV